LNDHNQSVNSCELGLNTDNCILIQGLPPNQQCISDQLVKFFNETLQISPQIKSSQTLHGSSHCNQLLVELNSRQDKQIIFRNCHKLKGYHRKVSIRDFTTCGTSFTANIISRKTPTNKLSTTSLVCDQEVDSLAKNENNTDVFWEDDDVIKQTEVVLHFTQNLKWEEKSLDDMWTAACGPQHNRDET